jgi:hypothetical protein
MKSQDLVFTLDSRLVTLDSNLVHSAAGHTATAAGSRRLVFLLLGNKALGGEYHGTDESRVLQGRAGDLRRGLASRTNNILES